MYYPEPEDYDRCSLGIVENGVCQECGQKVIPFAWTRIDPQSWPWWRLRFALNRLRKRFSK